MTESRLPVPISPLYGLLAEFETPEAVLDAARRCLDQGFTAVDGFAPYPLEGLPEAVGYTRRRLPFVVLAGGLFGGLGAYFMLWYACVISYPINVAGRPLHSWPSFIPITFEMAVLFAAFGAVFGMLAMNRLPQPYHPLFNVDEFRRASHDRFFLCIEAVDPRFDRHTTRSFLEETDAVAVFDVRP